jgi:hypothetical protein
MWYWLCDGSWVRGRRGWISESFAAVLDSWLVLHRGFLQRLSAIFACNSFLVSTFTFASSPNTLHTPGIGSGPASLAKLESRPFSLICVRRIPV